MKNVFFNLILATGLFGWLSFFGCVDKKTPPVPPVVVDTVAIQTADSISRNWFCASIKAPDETVRALSVLGKAWPTGSVIKVKFIGGTTAQRAWPLQAMKEISAFANIKFEVVASGNADCRISFDPSQGAWSYIGTDAKGIPQTRATCNIGWTGLDVAIHELMHFVSFGHEQSSPIGSICWDKPVVYAALAAPPNGWSKAMVDANVFYQYSANQVDATVFDPISVMEYQIPASWTCNKVGIPGGKVLSEKDKFMLGKIYPGVTAPPPPPAQGITITRAQADSIKGAGKLVWRDGKANFEIMAKKPAPQPAPPPFTIPGEFVRQTFIREYKAKGNSEAAAVAYFDNGLKLGNIIKLRYRGDVCIYEFKK